jgi:rhodanese-related sulfurtransferase
MSKSKKKETKRKNRRKMPAGEWALWATVIVVAVIALAIILLNQFGTPGQAAAVPTAQQATSQQISTQQTNPQQSTLLPQADRTQVAIFAGVRPTSTPAAGPTPTGAISLDQAFLMYQHKDYFLDVRTQNEFELYRIPNSISIPLTDLQNRATEVPRDKDIVIVCYTSDECMQARDILQSTGLSRLFPMIDGIESWVFSGYPFEGKFPY